MSDASPADVPDGGTTHLRPLAGLPTKSERVYQSLRDAILDGELEPGSGINVTQTARRLGTSETPVREALKRLESERLVHVEPYTGFAVADIGLVEMIENLVLRREIEAVATRLAARSLSADDLVQLYQHIEQMDAAARSGNWQSYARTNKKFHLALISKCPLSAIRRTAIELWEMGERSRLLFVQHPRTERSNEEHRAMLRAIENGDFEALGELVRCQKTVTIQLALELVDGASQVELKNLLGALHD